MRGQLAVFVILGIIIIAVVVGVLIIVDDLFEPRSHSPYENYRSLVIDCADAGVAPAVDALARQGGMITTGDLEVVYYVEQPVYYTYDMASLLPGDEAIATYLEERVAQALPSCLDRAAFEEQGCVFTEERPLDVEVRIADEALDVTVHDSVATICGEARYDPLSATASHETSLGAALRLERYVHEQIAEADDSPIASWQRSLCADLDEMPQYNLDFLLMPLAEKLELIIEEDITVWFYPRLTASDGSEFAFAARHAPKVIACE